MRWKMYWNAILYLLIQVPTNSYADNLTVNQMEQYTNSRYCPADSSTYNDISMKDQCDNYCNQNGWGSQACSNCQSRVIEDNNKIYRYNRWIRSCHGR